MTMSGPSTSGAMIRTEFKENKVVTQLKTAKNVPLDVKGRKRLATASISDENFTEKKSKASSVVIKPAISESVALIDITDESNSPNLQIFEQYTKISASAKLILNDLEGIDFNKCE